MVSQIQKAISGNFRQYGMMIALGLLIVLFQVLTEGLFLAPRNVTSLLVQNGYILILAIGMVMVIIAGHIDLSVGSVCALVGAVAALSMKAWAMPWPMAILIGLPSASLWGVVTASGWPAGASPPTGAPWLRLTETPVTLNGRPTVLLEPVAAGKFYRLTQVP